MAKRWRVPMILNISDLWPDSALQLGLLREGATARAMRRLESWAYRHADFITAVTQGIRKALVSEKGVPEKKLLFMPNGVDTEVFRPRPFDESLAHELGVDGKAVMLSAGTIGYGAGLDVVLDAAKRLSDQPVAFVLAGAGSERNRLREASTARELTNVHFIGPRTPTDVARLYSIATAGLTTLLDSPLFVGTRPARTLATMACQKPVIYSGAGEGASLVEEAGAGLIVAPEDSEALTNAVCAMLADADTAEEMGRRGRRFVEANLTWDTLVDNWLAQLERAMHRKAAS
jgi:glycosyltransferase involved in cell wall biosynthesis